MISNLGCCSRPMDLVAARPQDAPFEFLLHCRDCGHYEPWDVDDDPATGGAALLAENRP